MIFLVSTLSALEKVKLELFDSYADLMEEYMVWKHRKSNRSLLGYGYNKLKGAQYHQQELEAKALENGMKNPGNFTKDGINSGIMNVIAGDTEYLLASPDFTAFWGEMGGQTGAAMTGFNGNVPHVTAI